MGETETALVKFGGSVITDKRKSLTFLSGNVLSLSSEIFSFMRGGRKRRVVIVHGGGSFGHIKAKSYSIAGGLKRTGQLRGYAEVRSDMRNLNGRIVSSLLDSGVSAIAVQAESIVSFSGRRVIAEDFSMVDRALEHGLVPVTFGDAVFDNSLYFTIISGDVLMESLCRHLKPDVAVFCTDVDGVYDRNPSKNRNARLLDRLDRSTVVETTASSRPDVTGEMEGKLSVLFNIAENSGRALVINGRISGRLYAALSGKNPRGTRVLPD